MLIEKGFENKSRLSKIVESQGYKEAREDVSFGRVYKAKDAEEVFFYVLGYIPSDVSNVEIQQRKNKSFRL
ncbi:MAG: hypothetical protein E7072_07345 [Bacteroidales bacterium]|nr:hypothetical protein [Bacteroidales bacterium]MBO5131933.1 hypothetical protein [Paludibacteraceae bacterium]